MKIINTIIEQAKPPIKADGSGPKPPRNTGGSTTPKPAPETGSSVFNCIFKSKYNYAIEKPKNQNQIRGEFVEVYWFFNSDGVFFTKKIDNVNGPSIDKGVWKCEGTSNFIITLKNGKTFSSKVGEWVDGKSNTTSSVFGCVFKGDNTTKKTKSPRQVMATAGSGVIQKWFFFNNGDFVIKIKDIKEKTTDPRFIGKWECDGGDEFIIKTNDGFTYSSKTEEWVEKPNSGTSGSSNGTTIKLSDIKNGTKSVKIGTKGSVVTKIQDLLIGLGYNDVSNSGKSDGNFGPKTDGMVKKYQKDNDLKDDGIVGSKTITALLAGKSDATKVEPAVTTPQPDSIQGTDGVIIKEKEKLDILQESVKKLLRKSLLGFRKK
jgi:hypothetical protein